MFSLIFLPPKKTPFLPTEHFLIVDGQEPPHLTYEQILEEACALPTRASRKLKKKAGCKGCRCGREGGAKLIGQSGCGGSASFFKIDTVGTDRRRMRCARFLVGEVGDRGHLKGSSKRNQQILWFELWHLDSAQEARQVQKLAAKGKPLPLKMRMGVWLAFKGSEQHWWMTQLLIVPWEIDPYEIQRSTVELL